MLTEDARRKILALNLVGFATPSTEPKPANAAATDDGAAGLTKNGLVKSGLCKVGLAHKTAL